MRPSRERGVTAVVVALVIVVLCGFAAVAVDMGALWWDRKELQNGADAGAIAIAQACAKGACGNTATDADTFAKRNKLDGNATGVVTSLTSNSVTVAASSTRQLWFANVLGISSAPVSASATATWAVVSGGSTLPFAISACQFFWQTNSTSGSPPSTTTEYKIISKKAADFPAAGATGSFDCGSWGAHNEVAGGFGWLDANAQCVSVTSAGNWVSSNPGNNEPGCLQLVQNQSYLIPLFDATTGSGNNGTYHLTGYAEFKVTGWCLSGSAVNSDGKCTGNNRHIRGYFVAFVSLQDAQTGGASTNYGVRSVDLAG